MCICICNQNFGKRISTKCLVTASKLKEILSEVRKMLQVTNPDYDLVIDRLHLYYDMQLVTFGIDRDKNLIVQFPVFI